MIYVCIEAHNNEATIGLLLWKIRNVFAEFPREYQLMVVNDASTDETAKVLNPYEKSLPLTVITQSQRLGRAGSLELLLREAASRSDRHKRDCVITIPADFSVSPDVIPELVKRFESGADVVVGELNPSTESFGERLVQRLAPRLLSPGIAIPGVQDLTSGCCAFRIVTIKKFLGNDEGHLLETEGACTYAELVARAASLARQITTEPVSRGPGKASRFEYGPLVTSLNLLMAGRRLSIPGPAVSDQ